MDGIKLLRKEGKEKEKMRERNQTRKVGCMRVMWRGIVRWGGLKIKGEGRINREYNRVLRIRIIRIVRAMRMIRARVRRRGKYRLYGGIRVRLVRISYEVVLLLVLLRLGSR